MQRSKGIHIHSQILVCKRSSNGFDTFAISVINDGKKLCIRKPNFMTDKLSN